MKMKMYEVPSWYADDSDPKNIARCFRHNELVAAYATLLNAAQRDVGVIGPWLKVDQEHGDGPRGAVLRLALLQAELCVVTSLYKLAPKLAKAYREQVREDRKAADYETRRTDLKVMQSTAKARIVELKAAAPKLLALINPPSLDTLEELDESNPKYPAWWDVCNTHSYWGAQP